MKKSDKIVELSKNKAEQRKIEVLSCIKKMEKRGEKVSFYKVMKLTGASKSYLYGNSEIRETIEKIRGSESKKKSKSSNQVIITAQKKKIEVLEKKIKELEKDNSESYKAKYLRILEENKELKKQIKNALYSY